MNVEELTLPFVCWGGDTGSEEIPHQASSLPTLTVRKGVYRVMSLGELALCITSHSTWESELCT